MRADAYTLCKLGIQCEQEALLSALGTSLHPLPLGHQFHGVSEPRQRDRFRFFFNFDDFFTSVL
jgi:hypothetical protein